VKPCSDVSRQRLPVVAVAANQLDLDILVAVLVVAKKDPLRAAIAPE